MPRKNPPPGGLMIPLWDVVYEFVSAVTGERNIRGEGATVVDRITDVLKRNLQINSVVDILGRGLFGTASLMKDGTVLKITSDMKEIETAAQIVGDDLDHVAEIYEAVRLGNIKIFHKRLRREVGVGVVISQLLTPWMEVPELEESAEILTKAVRSVQREFGTDAGSIELKSPREQRHALRESSLVLSQRLKDVASAYELPAVGEVADGIDELFELGIFMVDVHQGNVGLDDNGVTRIFDLGISSAPMTKTLLEINPRPVGGNIFTPEFLIEKWFSSKDSEEKSFYKNRPELVAEMRRLGKRLKGWKSAEELTVKNIRGVKNIANTGKRLKELRGTQLIQIAWDAQGVPHYAWANEKRPNYLYVEDFPWEREG